MYLVWEEYDFDGIVYLTLRARTFYIILMVNVNHWGVEGLAQPTRGERVQAIEVVPLAGGSP